MDFQLLSSKFLYLLYINHRNSVKNTYLYYIFNIQMSSGNLRDMPQFLMVHTDIKQIAILEL